MNYEYNTTYINTLPQEAINLIYEQASDRLESAYKEYYDLLSLEEQADQFFIEGIREDAKNVSNNYLLDVGVLKWVNKH